MTKLVKLFSRFAFIFSIVLNVVLLAESNQTTQSIEVQSKDSAYMLTCNNDVNIKPVAYVGEVDIQEEPKTQEEIINEYVFEICNSYNLDPYLVMSVIYHESRYQPEVSNGDCVGLMQISTRWHQERAKKLNVNDFYDPYSNILLGVDLLAELFDSYKDYNVVLMAYNMGPSKAIEYAKQGKTTNYATNVLQKAEEFRTKGVS